MTVISNLVYPRLVAYTVGATPSTGPFDIPFPFYDDDTVSVFIDGTEISAYTITKASEFGTEGNFVTLDAVTSNSEVIIQSTTSSTRSTGESFVQAQLSQELDRVFARFQEIAEARVELSTSARALLSSLEIPAPEAGTFLGWDATGLLLENKNIADAGTLTVPGSTTDNSLPRFSGTDGKTLQESDVTISDTNLVAGATGYEARDLAPYVRLTDSSDNGIMDLIYDGAKALIDVDAADLIASSAWGVNLDNAQRLLVDEDGVVIGAGAADRALRITGTDAIKVPAGTTAQEPGTPEVGDLRFDTTINKMTAYDGSAFTPLGGATFDLQPFTAGGTVDLDLSAGNVFYCDNYNANTTFTISNPQTEDEVLIYMKEGAQTFEIDASRVPNAVGDEFEVTDTMISDAFGATLDNQDSAHFGDNGNYLFVFCDYDPGTGTKRHFIRFDLARPYEIYDQAGLSTMTYTTGQLFDVETAVPGIINKAYDLIDIANDGSAFFIENSDIIYKFSMSTPYDLSTMSSSANSGVLSQTADSFSFSPDGTRAITTDNSANRLTTYTCSPAYDVTALTQDVTDQTLVGAPSSAFINNAGTFLVAQVGSSWFGYSLSTPGDPSTGTLIWEIFVSASTFRASDDLGEQFWGRNLSTASALRRRGYKYLTNFPSSVQFPPNVGGYANGSNGSVFFAKLITDDGGTTWEFAETNLFSEV